MKISPSVLHGSEQIVAFGLPLIINWIMATQGNGTALFFVGAVLSFALKMARDNGWLPDYVNSAPSANSIPPSVS